MFTQTIPLPTCLRTLLLAGFMLCIPAVVHAQADPTSAQAAPALPPPNSALVPGDVIVGVRTGRAALEQILQAHQLADVRVGHSGRVAGTTDDGANRDMFNHAANLCWLDMIDGGDTITMQRLSVPAGQELAIAIRLERDPAIVFASPNWTVRAAAIPAAAPVTAHAETPFLVNDPLYTAAQWYLQRINASRAWAVVFEQAETASASAVQIAIIDSGINIEHPEFAGRLMAGHNYLDSAQPPADDFGHGSHVAGLMGAVLSNGVGVAGLATHVQFDPRKVLDQFGSGSIFNVAEAICDATDAGADIINLSLETSASNVVLEGAVQYAHEHGVLLAAAAGNFDQSTVQWPARYPEVIAVAATDYDNQRAGYSTRGEDVELAAPGGDNGFTILSTWRARQINESNNALCPSYLNRADAAGVETYCFSKGTSMSAALVSGVAALIWAMRPELTAEQVRTYLRETATPLEFDATEVGTGLLDAAGAARRTLRSDLRLRADALGQLLTPGAAPYTVTIALENPSSEPLNWSAAVPKVDWLITHTITNGVLAYGRPATLSLVISPTHLAPGPYGSAITILGTRADSSHVSRVVNLNFTVAAQFTHSYLPVAYGANRPTPAGALQTFQWETDAPAGRTFFALADRGSLIIPISITFPLKGQAYTSVRLHADGFLSFPSTELAESLPNRCLPHMHWPQEAIYGWWADLDPSASGARVAMFQPDASRVVFEFQDVPAKGVTPAYRVSFQIVLHESGNVGLNYLHAPPSSDPPLSATVGVHAVDGRFYNQIACNDGTLRIGVLPQARQSFLIGPRDIF